MLTITPKRPIADAKISTIRILTKRDPFWASARAAPDPTMPTAIPQKRLQNPTVSPAPNRAYPENTVFLYPSGDTGPSLKS